MKSICRCRGIVTEGFEELALALGGVTASYEIPDEAVWDLARAVDVTHDRMQAGIAQTEVVTQLDEVPESGFRHPAVSYLLQRLRRSHTVSLDEGRAM